ncbi:hypothetical protein [Bacillus sp. TSA_307]
MAWFSHAIFFLQPSILYQVIKELHKASLAKVFGYAKPKFI